MLDAQQDLCAALLQVIGICGPRGSGTSLVADWMREAFHCRNPVIRVEDFYKVAIRGAPVESSAPDIHWLNLPIAA